MRTAGRDGRQRNHVSLRGTGSGSWFPMMVLLACTPAAWPQGRPALPALSADQVVQRADGEEPGTRGGFAALHRASAATAWNIAASPPLQRRRWKWK